MTRTRWAAVLGGAAWAITPLRDVLYGSPVTPGSTAYTIYDLVIVLIAVSLAVGLHTVPGGSGRAASAGVGVLFVGYLMLALSGIPTGSASVDPLLGDLGFLGALVTGVGAVPLGIALWRRGTRTAGALLALTLPAGLPALFVISSAGYEGVAGLALTVPFGLAWCLLGAVRSAAVSRVPASRVA